MKHRSAIKRRSKQRYRRVRHTSQHRRHQHLYSQHPERFHRIGSSEVALPFYSPTLGRGVVTGVCGATVYYRAQAEGAEVTASSLNWDDFTKDATFLTEEGVEEFFTLLDDEVGSPLWALEDS
jgi:hypothetical protein